MVAGLEGDVGCAAAGAVTGDLEGGDFGVVAEVVLVPAFAGELAVAVEQDAADGGVGRGEGDASAGEREGAVHPVGVLVGGGRAAAKGSYHTALVPIEILADSTSVTRDRSSVAR